MNVGVSASESGRVRKHERGVRNRDRVNACRCRISHHAGGIAKEVDVAVRVNVFRRPYSGVTGVH